MRRRRKDDIIGRGRQMTKNDKCGSGRKRIGYFFKSLAQELLNDSEFKEIIHFIKDNRKKHYYFKYSKKDIELLLQVGNIVNSFNDVLKKAIKKVDKNVMEAHPDAEINNFISFSSKYMHFQLKNIVFIKDSISAAHLLKWESRRITKN